MEKARAEIKRIESRVLEIKQEMSSLKSELYSQFGDNINLENEEEWAKDQFTLHFLHLNLQLRSASLW